MRDVAGFGSFVETRERSKVGWVREDLADLGLDAFWARLEPMPGAKGRGGIGRLDVGGRQLVVRPYRRGGALGSLLADRYPKPARAREELEVLYRLQQEGVPVVSPVAAVARRHGAFWRLRLCTEWLPEARTVPQFLAEFPERRRQAAEAVGMVVQLAFAAGLRHPDLHFDNVLCSPSGDKVRAVLVDLDKARLEKPVGDRARDEMLARMQRYVVKHRSKLPTVPTRAETMRFLRGLGLDRERRHVAWRSLHGRVERAMQRRRWLRK